MKPENSLAHRPFKGARSSLASVSGFSLLEVLFAIAMLAVGIGGLLSLFTAGITAASDSGNMTAAALEAQTLATRIATEVEEVPVDGGKKGETATQKVFLERIVKGKEWIHTASNSQPPVLIDPKRDYWWQCRARNVPLDPDDLFKDDASNKTPYPPGLYQIVIGIYRNYKLGKRPIAVYTTLVRADN
jgi:Tfp pilus assembly protein PilV